MQTPTAALHDLPAHTLLQGYRQRTISPVEVVQAVLDRIDRWEPHLHATWLLRPEAALAQARASEARWLRGAPQGLLDGVPCTLKDNIATGGDPTPLGTAAIDLVPAPADAPPALADRCAYPPVGAASSRSSPAWGVSPSTRPTPGGQPDP